MVEKSIFDPVASCISLSGAEIQIAEGLPDTFVQKHDFRPGWRLRPSVTNRLIIVD